ncbi:RING-CH-type domain-containing protein [Entamoeba marina]
MMKVYSLFLSNYFLVLPLFFFLVGIWSIINLLLKMCFGNAGEDVDLSARDVTRIGSCCSLCLCCMPYTWKKSFLANRGCCFLCKLLPNTLLTLVDCTSLCRCAFWYYCCCTPTRYYHRPYYMRPFVPVTPFIVYTPPGGCGCCRECANESCAGCCDCCTGIDCCVETNCCDGCGNGCGNCNCNGGGDAGLSILLMFLIGIVVIIIIFGFFVSVCAGIVMVTLLVKKNFDFVKKQANAETYIIDDWNENDHPMPTQNPPSISSNQNMDFYNEQMPLNPTVEYQENNFGNQYLQPPYEQNYQQNGVQQPPDMVIDMSAPPPNAQYVL